MEKTLKILLLEDNSGDARLAQELLKDNKDLLCEVEWVDRLASAVERLRRGGVDVILADLALPDCTGLEILARLHTQAPQIPTVVLTGTYDEKTGVEAVRLGAQDYLLKDRIDGYSLSRSIRYSIERKRTEEAILKKVKELDQMNKIMMNREMRILELKEEVERLRAHTSIKKPEKEISG